MGLSTYLKPLFRSRRLKKLMERVLKRKLLYNMGRAGVKAIKKAQKKTSKKGVRIRKGLHFIVHANSVTFYMNAIGHYQNYGVRRHKMSYLLKQPAITVPIMKNGEIVRENGKPVFRTVTRKSMMKPGSWVSSGWKAKKFFEDGVAQMRKDFKKKLAKNMSGYIKK